MNVQMYTGIDKGRDLTIIEAVALMISFIATQSDPSVRIIRELRSIWLRSTHKTLWLEVAEESKWLALKECTYVCVTREIAGDMRPHDAVSRRARWDYEPGIVDTTAIDDAWIPQTPTKRTPLSLAPLTLDMDEFDADWDRAA